MKRLLLAVLSLSLLTSCSSDDSGASSSTQTSAPASTAGSTSSTTEAAPATSGSNYSYDFQGTTIALGENFATALSSLEEPNDYFEAASCAFEGLDKIYYFSGLEVRTYPQEEEDFVSTILLKDDTVTTNEGAYIGMNIDEALEKHGEGYTQDNKQYVYSSGDSTLTFITSDDAVIAINYSLPDIEAVQ